MDFYDVRLEKSVRTRSCRGIGNNAASICVCGEIPLGPHGAINAILPARKSWSGASIGKIAHG